MKTTHSTRPMVMRLRRLTLTGVLALGLVTLGGLPVPLVGRAQEPTRLNTVIAALVAGRPAVANQGWRFAGMEHSPFSALTPLVRLPREGDEDFTWAVKQGAQGGPPAVDATRLYVLDGGTLTISDPSGFGVTIEDVKGFSAMPVPAYLVVHPAGTLLWDAGLGDHLVGRPASETQRGSFGQVVTTTLRGQLAEIGYTPERITYLAMSHMHFDHVGNANDYAASSWIVQKAEQDAIDFTNPERTAAFSALRDSKTIVVDGDHDVFGDGTVVIKSTPGHTPGHQSLFVNLVGTGPVVLSGDLYHYAAERTLGKMPAREVGPGLTAASRETLEAFIKETGAQLWIQHEVMLWATLEKSPAYYE